MIRVGIVAPSRRLTEEAADRIQRLVAFSGLPVELVIHSQCHLAFGHFAGTDAQRLDAFLEMANDPTLDAIWFARGGYGAARLLDGLADQISPAALTKVYLGYSDLGFLFAGLMNLGCRFCAHGPLVADIDRPGGEATALRALTFLARDRPCQLANGVARQSFNLAFNLTVLRSLLGTRYEPKCLETSVLWLEDVGEYDYATDRAMFQLSESNWFKANIGEVRIGRFSLVPENEVQFSLSSPQIIAHWSDLAGVPASGGADIGHDANNKIVPFGRLEHWYEAGLITEAG
jgi:muramoyltetrapeptide carboxypeptidase